MNHCNHRLVLLFLLITVRTVSTFLIAPGVVTTTTRTRHHQVGKAIFSGRGAPPSSCLRWEQHHQHQPAVLNRLEKGSCLRAASATDQSSDASSSSSPSGEEQQGVVVERLPDSAVVVHIPVPGTATKAAYDKLYMELCQKIQIPGFRRGSKIPPQVLEQHMAAKGGRNALKVQAINELVGQLIEPTLKEQSLDPIGQATLKVPAEKLAESFVPGEPLMLDVQCDVWPEIKWLSKDKDAKPYVGLTGSYRRKPFSQDKLDMALRDLKERYATLEPITDDPDYQLQMGDACTVNMEGYMALEDGETKGEPLPNAASGDNVEIIMGTGRYMEGLVEGLVGAKVGDTRVVKVSFPEKLRDRTLAGKRAIFDVQVLGASKRQVPELTDEFANKVRAGLTAESLREELVKAIDSEDGKEFIPARNKALSDALIKRVEVNVPETLVTNQAREKFAMMLADMRSNGVADEEIKRQISPENFSKYKEIVKDGIVRDFKVSMATDEIARLEGITVQDYQVEEQMEAIRKDAASSSEEFDEKMVRAKVQTTLERQAVMDWLAENSKLTVLYGDEEEPEFDEELMQELAEESLKREIEGTESSEEATTTTAAGSSKDAAPAKDGKTKKKKEKATSKEDEEAKAARYASLPLEERAFEILKDLGAVGSTADDNDDDDEEEQLVSDEKSDKADVTAKKNGGKTETVVAKKEEGETEKAAAKKKEDKKAVKKEAAKDDDDSGDKEDTAA